METLFNKLINIFGLPYYKNEFGILFNLDCLSSLRKLDSAFFNATITSPPYNIGKSYETVMPIKDYIDWLSQVCEQIYRTSKSDANYLLNLGYLNVAGEGRAVPIPYLLWNKTHFYLNQEIIWNYGAGVCAKKYLSPRNEKILWLVKNPEEYTFNLDAIRDPDVKYPNSKKNGKSRCNSIGKNPSDVWQIAKVTSGANRSSAERTIHPAQFPEDLITRLVLGFTKPNDIILEPFMGSGTVGVVAMKNNRYFVGFEINEEYCQICKKRLQKTELEIKTKQLTINYT